MTDPAPNGRSLSLTSRLAIGLVALLLVGGVVLALAAFAYGRVAAREAFDRLLVGAANDIAESISISDGELVIDLPVSAFELLALAKDDRIAYQVRGVDGRVLTGYDDLPVPTRAQQPGPDEAFFDAGFKGEPARFLRLTRRFAERSLSGDVEVIVGQTLLARNELAYDITRNALVGLAMGGAAIIMLALLMVRSALRPLGDLAGTIAARDPQDLTPLDPRGPREIAVTANAINGFMRRLDQQFDAMRNLISDTAHQLRTPVAALRAQSDLALHEQNPERRNRLVERIHRRTVSLGRLLDQMLSRALVIHRLESARREIVDLRDIALDIVESGDHMLIAPGTEVRVEVGPEPVNVKADAISLTEAAKNLLGNALAHGRAPVTVGADLSNGKAMLWVADAGEGPSQAVLESLGERFLRSAASRGESAGLGLSIAGAVAEAFGGRLEWDAGAGGFRISIVLTASEDGR
ncbi:histidine kinase [Ruegeria marisrubri]|uniref:histidine kinase n=1 Tax=Ruegeria marisrubri TaxID=1685379 RepID=A0A0X3TDG7_9RHOB|nr:sensor histidine kinase N-terminal domain-containing protein [Ruegeria marisrubri]KUJ73161.1 histidine kinase [Ruegeria marisrubri]